MSLLEGGDGVTGVTLSGRWMRVTGVTLRGR